MSNNFYLENLFSDTEQNESVIFISELNLFFVLRLGSLSYYMTPDKKRLKLIQWKFNGNKLIVDDSSGSFVITRAKPNGKNQMINFARVEKKQVINKGQSKIEFLKGITSEDIEKHENLVNMSLIQKISFTLKKDGNYKKLIIPSLFMIFLLYMLTVI